MEGLSRGFAALVYCSAVNQRGRTIIRVCNDSGFSPRVHNELNNMHSVLSTVEAEEGIPIVSASTRNLRADNVSFFRLQPDDVRIDFVAAWQKKEPSVALKLFLELLDEELPRIRQKTRYFDQ
jgi:DNA-binding transcriptional LysR family regulator